METYQPETHNNSPTIGDTLSQLPAIVNVNEMSFECSQVDRLNTVFHRDIWHPDIMADSAEKEVELKLRLQSINLFVLKAILGLTNGITSPNNPPSPTLIRALPNANGIMEAYFCIDMAEVAFQAQQAINFYQTENDSCSFDGDPAEKQYQWQQQETAISIFSAPEMIKPYIITEQDGHVEVFDCYKGRKNLFSFDRQRNSWSLITDDERKINYSVPLPLQEQDIERMETIMQRINFV